MLTTKMIKDLNAGAVKADKAAPGPWRAVAHVLEAGDESLLLTADGHVKNREVAAHMAAADPLTVVALTERVLAHESALEVLRAAVVNLRDAYEGIMEGEYVISKKKRGIDMARDALFALLPPEPPAELAKPQLDNYTTYYLFSKAESDEGTATGLPLLAFLRAVPRPGTTLGLNDFTFLLAEAAKVTEVFLRKGYTADLTPVLCKEVDRVAMDGRVHNKHLPAIEKAVYVPGRST